VTVDWRLAARFLRRARRRYMAQRRFPHADTRAMPIFFGNSFPKSGTHLLTQILAGFTRLGPVVESGLPPVLTFAGESGRPRPLDRILAELRRLQPGEIGYGHLHALPEIVAYLCRDGMAPYFIYRDPRDVVVSHVFYVTDLNSNHVHHDYYVNELGSFEQRLTVSILGRPELANPFPDIRRRFEPYLPWLERPEVHSLRYEDIVHDQAASLEGILEHAIRRGFSLSGGREWGLQVLAQAIDPARSPTFRSGQTGGWRQHFTPEISALFKEVSGDLLLRLGYEQDTNW